MSTCGNPSVGRSYCRSSTHILSQIPVIFLLVRFYRPITKLAHHFLPAGVIYSNLRVPVPSYYDHIFCSTCIHTYVFTGGFLVRGGFCSGSFVRVFLSGRFCPSSFCHNISVTTES